MSPLKITNHHWIVWLFLYTLPMSLKTVTIIRQYKESACFLKKWSCLRADAEVNSNIKSRFKITLFCNEWKSWQENKA